MFLFVVKMRSCDCFWILALQWVFSNAEWHYCGALHASSSGSINTFACNWFRWENSVGKTFIKDKIWFENVIFLQYAIYTWCLTTCKIWKNQRLIKQKRKTKNKVFRLSMVYLNRKSPLKVKIPSLWATWLISQVHQIPLPITSPLSLKD